MQRRTAVRTFTRTTEVNARERRALTDMERAFVRNYAILGMPIGKAAIAAGYSPTVNASTSILNKLVVAEAIRDAREDNARRLNVTREKIYDGILGAIERARIMSEPATEIMGWRDLAKMCGFDTPENKNAQVSDTQRRLIQKFENMSDAQLAAVLAEPVGEVIDGQAEGLVK